MLSSSALEEIRGWFIGRMPEAWRTVLPEVVVDREEITVVLTVPAVGLPEGAAAAEVAAAAAGRARAFREESRDARVRVAREAEQRFGRKVAWGVRVGEGDDAVREVWTRVSAPVMTRLRQPERLVLDTLVDAGVARSRSDALAWCVRLVGQHEGDWLADLRTAMEEVAELRSRGPSA